MFKENIKLGIAPIAWTNDDMPDLGAENTFEQCISEMAIAGFSGTEIGNKYPKNPEELKNALDLRGMEVANSWISTFLTTEPFEVTEKAFREKCEFLKAVGAKRIGASEQGHSIQGTALSVFEDKYVMNDKEWKLLTEGLSKLGKIAKEYGITLTYHHHMGTVVQTEEEINRLMSETDADSVFLLFDSGHLAYSGENYMSVLKKYAKRIKHVHLKDIRPDKVQEVKEKKLSFLEGVRLGTFTVPGDGAIDFKPIFDILSDAGYEGWLLVEAEQDPELANPLEYAIKARKYIRQNTGI